MVISFIVGFLAVALTFIAYWQTERIRFLKVNLFAVLFFGLSLFLVGAVTGALISFFNAAVYAVAIFTSKHVREKLSYLLPPIAFFLAYLSIDSLVIPIEFLQHYYTFIPAIGSLLVVLAALQTSMLLNKLILLVGVIMWGIYSLLTGAYFAFTADLIGAATIVISIFRIHNCKF